MSVTNYTILFLMKSGNFLECHFSVESYPATFDDPGESHASQPQYFVGDEEVNFDDLPKGLAYLAELMYTNMDARPDFHVRTCTGKLRFDDNY